LLQVNQVSHGFGPQTVLEGINLKLTTTSRVGLVGANGGGKSTLLGLMMGEMDPLVGNISKTPGTHLNWLTQNPRLTYGNTLNEELYSVFDDLNAAKTEANNLLATLNDLSDTERVAALNRLDYLQDLQKRLGADDLDARIGRMVQGLGFSLEQLNHKVEHFSGGWQMRINLAKVLLQGADILLMDEPTNHLDLAACEWLEQFLKVYPGGLLVVSHDRRFLDAIVTEVAELDRGQLTVWSGNYTQYLSQKEALNARLTSAANRQEKALADQMAFVDRFRASATKSKQAKSREKQLAKIERIEAPKAERQQLAMDFPVERVSGREVLTLRHVAKTYGQNTLYTDLTATMERQQRIFLLGDNGCGKSTLFRLITEAEKPDKGEIKLGHHVKLGYYAQHHLETLDPKLNVYETMEGLMPTAAQSKIRALLGCFLFKGDEVFKRVEVLSGGEKSRLALAKLLVTGPNTLLLDEPTNHLDIPSQQAVEDALDKYQGSILCISHDRQFIQRLATHIWEFYKGQLITFEGNYDEYLSKRNSLKRTIDYAPENAAVMVNGAKFSPGKKDKKQKVESHAASAAPPTTSSAVSDVDLSNPKQVEKRLKQVEKAIANLDKQRKILQNQLEDEANASDYLLLGRLNEEHQDLAHQIQALEHEWETLAAVF
jgi:ATP-binding cassette, subfamily F, member 3